MSKAGHVDEREEQYEGLRDNYKQERQRKKTCDGNVADALREIVHAESRRGSVSSATTRETRYTETRRRPAESFTYDDELQYDRIEGLKQVRVSSATCDTRKIGRYIGSKNIFTCGDELRGKSCCVGIVVLVWHRGGKEKAK